jgi:hypothetical protein
MQLLTAVPPSHPKTVNHGEMDVEDRAICLPVCAKIAQY